jgi:hypothetical protein
MRHVDTELEPHTHGGMRRDCAIQFAAHRLQADVSQHDQIGILPDLAAAF